MRTIHKYVLRVLPTQIVEMPAGARPLYAKEQGDDVCVWAIVEPSAGFVESHRFHVYETGTLANAAAVETYLGSAHLADGAYVAHVFDGGVQ